MNDTNATQTTTTAAPETTPNQQPPAATVSAEIVTPDKKSGIGKTIATHTLAFGAGVGCALLAVYLLSGNAE